MLSSGSAAGNLHGGIGEGEDISVVPSIGVYLCPWGELCFPGHSI